MIRGSGSSRPLREGADRVRKLGPTRRLSCAPPTLQQPRTHREAGRPASSRLGVGGWRQLVRPYFEKDGITIYHGDCREIMPHVQADVMVTDPPYGVAFAGKSTKHTDADGIGYLSTDDSTQFVERVAVPIVAAWIGRGTRALVTPGVRNCWMYPRPDAIGSIFYPSGAGSGKWGFICSQPILYYGKDPYLSRGAGSRPDSFSSTESAPRNGHPCPKPIGVMRWLVNRGSFPGEVVVDPFCGSGTTLDACRDLGRKAIGIEIEERYCEIAAKRLAQGVLFT